MFCDVLQGGIVTVLNIKFCALQQRTKTEPPRIIKPKKFVLLLQFIGISESIPIALFVPPPCTVQVGISELDEEETFLLKIPAVLNSDYFLTRRGYTQRI